MADKNIDLAYKGSYFEQTAEFAEACGDEVIRERCYQKAIQAYKSGGWTQEALTIARKIQDSEQIKDLEGFLKIKNLNDTLKEMTRLTPCCRNSLKFHKTISEGIIIPLDKELRKQRGILLVQDYELSKEELRDSKTDNLDQIFRKEMNLGCYGMHNGWGFKDELSVSEIKLLTPAIKEQYNAYLIKCNQILMRDENPSDPYVTHGGIDRFNICTSEKELTKFDSPQGEFLGCPLEYYLSVGYSGNYDSGWNYYIGHGLRPQTNENR